jgi:DNA-binding transcriptional MerR regulator/DNA gyrase inhibitor GyrI
MGVKGYCAMYTIGEFSRISGLSIKALRLYHENGILEPGRIDGTTGYRSYDHQNVERARIILYLRSMDFGLSDIADMLEDAADDEEVAPFLEKKRGEILGKIERQKDILKTLTFIIKTEKETAMLSKTSEFEVEEKGLDTILIAGIRFKGKYSDCGDKFAKIGKAMGFNISGKAFSLYYDAEYKEDGADIESCMQVRKGTSAEGISVRELAGGRCVSLIHKGPYDTIGRSYERIMAYVKEKNLLPMLPSREVYLKGPGMIFKGNPENYLTEIQILFE